MMSVEIEPQYLAHDEDVENGNDYESLPGPTGGVTHQMILDGILSMPGQREEGEDEYGEEAIDNFEFTKIKKEKVFMQIDFNRRKTKIVATLGPSSNKLENICQLIDAGMTTARINLSHGTSKENLKLINKFKQAKRLRPHKNCALMIEVRGREIRMSHVDDKQGFLKIRTGSVATVTCGEFWKASEPNNIRINNETIQRYLKNNDVVYIDDGKVVGIVIDIQQDGFKMEIKIGGNLKGHSQFRFINGKHNQYPLLKTKDIEDLAAISQLVQIDYLTIPFVTNSDDVISIRKQLIPNGKGIQIISKIDSLDGVKKLTEILQETDGIIFVRNELQWELQSEKLMIAQKWATAQANEAAKPFMIMSQVLESMITTNQVQRKELQDISTACLDGADCFVLCHETSIGVDPVAAMVQLAKGIAEGENIFDYDQAFINLKEEVKNQPNGPLKNIDILAHTGCSIAYEQRENVDMFVCLTKNGKIARHLSKQKPKQPILACSTSGQVVRQVNMVRGVVGYKIPEYAQEKTEDLLELILQVAQEQLICNLPTSKVLIFIGQDEDDPIKEQFTFKLIGGEKPEDEEDDEEDEEIEEGDEDQEGHENL